MVKRKSDFRNAAEDPFGDSGLSVDASHLHIDSEIFGDIAAADAAVKRIEKFDIFEILPDFSQPRRAIPSSILSTWDRTTENIRQMLLMWWSAVEDERDQEFDLDSYLQGHETERAPADDTNPDNPFPTHEPGPLEAAFMRIVDLAASIRRDGLMNPVTVAPSGGQYQLETGERRWLAYHLLYLWFDGEEDRADESAQWGQIPAQRVERVDVWRQASENNARADLNAIGKARQWALLMMDLNDPGQFQPFSRFEEEREFYAQAVDLRPPYGKGEQVLNAMGVASRSALARYRALLTLPGEIWQSGDDLQLPEETLYNLALLARDDPDAAIERCRQIVSGQNNVAGQSRKSSSRGEPHAPGTKRHFSEMTRAVIRTGRGKHKQNAEALKYLREMRRWLDAQEEQIINFME